MTRLQEYEPHARLAGAVLLKAVEDWKKGRDKKGIDYFMNTSWFNILVNAVNMDAANVRKSLLSDSYNKQISTRSNYR